MNKIDRPWHVILAGLVLTAGACVHATERTEGVPTGTTVAPEAGLEQTALDRYVAEPDPTYSYRLAHTYEAAGCTVYVIDMTSQTWRSEKDIDRPVWKHWVNIVKPAQVKSDVGLLFISGGSNRNPSPPTEIDSMFLEIARGSGTVITELRMIPNQPIVFKEEGKERSEDAFIAYTWHKFLETGDETWPARLPMTKAAVRAMDTVTDFLASEEGGTVDVDKFVVAGGSKRGWTTWTTAAVDDRVVAFAPFVIDMLNLQESFKHHFRAYGFWAPAVGDYTAMGLMEVMDKPRYKELMKIVEPYSYRARYTMPKYIVNSTGDQFFLPDSSQFYYDDLPGEKYLRYVPNTDHGLDGSDALQSFLAWYASIVYGTPRPEFSWTLEEDGSIRVATETKPTRVLLWQATNPEARDFRKESIGTAWTSTELSDTGDGVYVGRVTEPEKGWTAFLVELEFPSGIQGLPFKFSTPVRIVPDVLPFADKI